MSLRNANGEAAMPWLVAARRARLVLHAAWPAGVWLGAVLPCVAWHDDFAYWTAALWGLLLLASFVAWGAALRRTVMPCYAYGWGFDGSLGLALTVFVFGLLACFRLVSVAGIVAWSTGGPIALGVVRLRSAREHWRGAESVDDGAFGRTTGAGRRLLRGSSLSFAGGLAVLYAMAALQYAQSVTDSSFNVYDDNMAYRSFARQFLDTGTLYEPFSFRRIVGYGGQSLGQAMVLALSDRDRLHIFDGGICLLLILGLVSGYRSGSPNGSRPAILAAGLVAMTLPFTPHNLASELSGCLFFLVLFRFFDHPHFEHATSTANAIVAGLLVAAVCTLRQNYIPAALALVTLRYTALVMWPGAKRRADWLVAAAATLSATSIFLLPWMALSCIAARTPLYPIVKGNIAPDYGFVGHVSWAETLRWTLENLFYSFPVGSIGLLFLAACALPPARHNGACHAFLFSTGIGFCLMTYFFRSFDQVHSMARYYFAFVTAFALAAVLRSLSFGGPVRTASRAFFAGALAMTAVGIHFTGAKDTIKGLYTDRISALKELIDQRGPSFGYGELDNLYRQIQDSVPRGQAILVMLDRTYLLDGRRNRIYDYDSPGAMGPRGAPPAFRGPEEFVSYLHKAGVRFIAYTLGPSSPEYRVDLWQSRADAVVPANGRGMFYKNQARFELDFFNTLTWLSLTRAVVFQDGDIRVLDVETRRNQGSS